MSQVTPPKKELECSANPTRDEILRARVFKEPLVQIGGEPSAEENAALAAALLGYAKRSGPDDFASLTSFLEQHPKTVWQPALLTLAGTGSVLNQARWSADEDVILTGPPSGMARAVLGGNRRGGGEGKSGVQAALNAIRRSARRLRAVQAEGLAQSKTCRTCPAAPMLAKRLGLR